MFFERRVWFLGSHSHSMILILPWSCLLPSVAVDENMLRCHGGRLVLWYLVLLWTCWLPQHEDGICPFQLTSIEKSRARPCHSLKTKLLSSWGQAAHRRQSFLVGLISLYSCSGLMRMLPDPALMVLPGKPGNLLLASTFFMIYTWCDVWS